MDTLATPVSKSDIAAAYDWWKLAGVDLELRDEATGWLDQETKHAAADATESEPKAVVRKRKPVEPRRAAVASAGIAPVGSEKAEWPGDLAAFRQWWVEDEKFASSGAFPRIAPRGPAQAELLVLVPQPEEGDSDTLLSGKQGALISGFLRAADLDEESVYFASVLPRHTLQPDWEEVGRVGYGALCAHHIALAAPKRIISFGRLVAPLLPHESAQASANLPSFNHEGLSIPLLPARDVANLLRRPGFRARFWQEWLEFTDG
ncbi:uracil-DNA glycosylase family protein [Parerythrobacter jejuensis]|uniref:Uracil-DNA glycosylase n=1 Tax=Parerythrobacter jejuensis TaxID=795812 RepID=A0A845ATN9_9SPHN|nr:hypothetical protein [Parerythrobacter jejuensis]MXP32513.1 hypothetical protein [Parerythrobacter jejuensis]